MRKFIVNVNGSSYEVVVEEIAAGAAPAAVAAPAAPVSAPSPAPAPAAAGQEAVNSPMPGNILDVRVKVGDAVKKNDVLLVLEAMKLENEILAPRDGSIAAVNVTNGSTVNSGDVLLVLA